MQQVIAPLSRRGFVAAGGAALASLAAGRRLRLVQVGTGGRGTRWASYILFNYGDAVELAGLCDSSASASKRRRSWLAPPLLPSPASAWWQCPAVLDAEKKSGRVLRV